MLRRFTITTLLTLMIFCFPVMSLAQAEGNYGLDATADAAKIPMGKSITVILGDVIGTALSLVSVLFFGLMLYAGIKWMLARGDEGEADKAKDTIIAAIIGLVVVLASYAITKFVFEKVGGGGGSSGKIEDKYCLDFSATKYSCKKVDGDVECAVGEPQGYSTEAACKKDMDVLNTGGNPPPPEPMLYCLIQPKDVNGNFIPSQQSCVKTASYDTNCGQVKAGHKPPTVVTGPYTNSTCTQLK